MALQGWCRQVVVFACIGLIGWAVPANAGAAVIHVFLVGGQSNADGRADPSTLPSNLQSPQTDIAFYSNYSGGLSTLRPRAGTPAQFGPEITFGRSMADYFSGSGDRVAILKYAAGGTNLYSQWMAGGDGTQTGDGTIYKSFQTTIAAGMNALRAANPSFTVRIDGMIWMQGESDAVATYGALYGTNLTAFISDIRQTYGANLPFVIGELSANQTGTGSAVYRNDVRSGQESVAAADALAGIVNTDLFSLKTDNLHFDTAGQQSLGYGFASEMQNMVAVPEPGSLGYGLAASLLGLLVWGRRGARGISG